MPSPVVLGEFAVNPACFCSSADLSIGLQVFGFEHGAIISDFPNGWHKQVRIRARQMPEPDRSLFLGKLDRFRERAIARVRPSELGDTWLQQAVASSARRPFHAILDEADSVACRCYSSALDDEKLRAGLRENKIPRNAKDLINSFWPLVVSSERFTVVDPYLAPDPPHRKFLQAIVAARRSVSKSVLFLDIHIEFDEDPREMRDGSSACKAAFQGWARHIGENIAVSISWWSDHGVGELHPRYLLTERGGVRLDRGAVVPSPLDQQDHDTDVSMLSDHLVREVERRYSGAYSPLTLVTSHRFRI